MRVVALGGEPATGKSTIARQVLLRLMMQEGHAVTFDYGRLKGLYFKGGVYFAGIYQKDDLFPGTDRLSMAVQPHALEFISTLLPAGRATFFFEGDRLFTKSFFEGVEKLGAELKIVVVTASPAEKLRRHRLRKDTQSESFLKGRRTKIENITRAFSALVVENDSQESTNRIADHLVALLRRQE